MTAPYIEDCRRLTVLAPGWDGYRGRPTSLDAIVSVLSGQVVPGAGGGCQIEWHLPDCDLEIEFTVSGAVKSVAWNKR